MNGSRKILTVGGAGLLGVIGLTFVAASCGGSSTPAAGDGGTAGSTGTAGTSGTAGAGTAGTTGTAGASGGPTTGAQGCTSVVSAFCKRDFECVDTNGTTADMATCVRQNGVAFGCAQATTENFADCIGDIRNLSCATLFPTSGSAPLMSCQNAFSTVPASTAQTQCNKLAAAACEKSGMCGGALTSDEMLQCEQDVATQINCDYATAVGATYNQCLTDLAAAPCTSADAGATADGGSSLPACDNAITYVN